MPFPLKLEVVSSKDVKSKKRWRKIQWDGEQSENISLLGSRTLAQFNLVTGKKRRVDASIRRLLGKVVHITGSTSGNCVVGILQDGHLFRWRKSTRTITNILPCPGFNPVTNSSTVERQGKTFRKPKLFISDDGLTIFLFSRHSGVYIWRGMECDNSGWTRITIGNAASSLLSSKGLALDVVYFSDKVTGPAIKCAFVSSTDDCISVGILSFPLQSSSPPSYALHKYPYLEFMPPCHQTRLRGSLVSSWSRNGKVLAVAVNQRQPSLTRILLIEPNSGGIINVGFAKILQSAVELSFWISSLTWTFDNLFLACCTRQGAVLLLSVNGTIMQIMAKSPAEKFGPGIFLPLEGVVSFRRLTQDTAPREIDESTDTSMQSVAVPPKFRKPYYSISAHPSLPILLCGDGYSVAAIKIMDGISHQDMIITTLGETVQRVERMIRRNQLQVTILKPLSFFTHSTSDSYGSETEQRWREIIKSTHDRILADVTLHHEADASIENSPEQQALLSFLIQDLDDSRLAQSESKHETSVNSLLIEDGATNLMKDVIACRAGLLSNLMMFSLTLEDGSLQRNQLVTDIPTTRINDSELTSMFAMAFKLVCDILLQLQDVADIFPPGILSESFISRSHHQTTSLRDAIGAIITSLAQGVLSLLSWNNLSSPVDSLFSAVVQEIVDTMLISSRKSSEGCLGSEDILTNLLQTFLFLDEAEAVVARQTSNLCQAYLSDPTSLEKGSAADQESTERSGSEDDDHLWCPKQLHFPVAWQTLLKYLSQLQATASNLRMKSKFIETILCHLQSQTFGQIVLPQECIDSDEIMATRVLLNVCKNLQHYNLAGAMHSTFRNLCYMMSNVKKWTDEKWLPVEILGTVMASYFCGTMVTVPSLTSALTRNDPQNCFEGHYVSLQQEKITAMIRSQSLDECWTLDNAILLLLSCGRVQEAAAISSFVGDWRTSFVLCALFVKTSFSNTSLAIGGVEARPWSIEHLLRNRFESILSAIFQAKVNVLEELFLNFEELPQNYADVNPSLFFRCLRDVLEVSTMVGVNLTTWSTVSILNTLKSKCCHGVSLLVSNDLNLPHPQLYLPQSSPGAENSSHEKKLRYEISAYARVLLSVLNATGIQRVTALWYLKYLDHESGCTNTHHERCCQRKDGHSPLSDYALLKDVTIQGLELKLDKLHGNATNDDIYILATVFRELCCMLWLFHARDNLNSALRRYQSLREKYVSDTKYTSEDGTQQIFPGNVSQNEVYEAIQQCLFWIRKIQPFSKFMQFESELEELILCVVSELPVNIDTAVLLAEFFHHERLITPKNKHRFGILVKKMQKVEILHPSAEQTVPLSATFNEECRKLAQTKISPFSGYFSIPQSMLDLKATGETSQTDTLSRDDPSVISKMSPENLLGSLENCYSFEADEHYHRFVFELVEIVLSKSPASMTFTPKKEGKSKPMSKPLSYPLVLSYRNEIALSKLEMIAPQNENKSTMLSMKVPILEKTVYPPGEDVVDGIVQQNLDPDRVSTKFQSVNALDWKFFSQAQRGFDIGLGVAGFVSEMKEIPCVNSDAIHPQLKKRLQRLIPYFGWLDYWRCQLVPIPNDLSQKQQLKPAMRVSVLKEHLIHGFTMAELRFGKKIKINEKAIEKHPTLRTEELSTLRTEEVASSILEEITADKQVESTPISEQTFPKITEEMDGDPDTADNMNKTVEPTELHSTSLKIEEQQVPQIGQDTLDQIPPIQPQEVNDEKEKASQDVSKQHSPEMKQSFQEKRMVETPVPSSETVFNRLISSNKPKEMQTQTLDVMSHSALSVASTGLQSDVMADGGGRRHRPKVATKKNIIDKQEMQQVVQNEIRNAMVGQQVLLLAQIFQSMMMQASTAMTQSQYQPPAPSVTRSMQQFSPQQRMHTQQPKVTKSEECPEVYRPPKKIGKLQILSLDGQQSHALPSSRFSGKPNRPTLALLTETQGLKKSQSIYLHDEKSNSPKMYTPSKMQASRSETAQVMYTGVKQPFTTEASDTKKIRTEQEQKTVNNDDVSTALTPDMLQQSTGGGSCPTCHSHPAPKTAVRIPLLSLANAVASRGKSHHIGPVNAIPRLMNIRQVLRHEHRRMTETGQQSQSISHIGKALPLLTTESIPGFYKIKPKFRELPFTIPKVEPSVQASTKSVRFETEDKKESVAAEFTVPRIADESRVEIPKELLPTVLTEEEAEEIRNGVLVHYKTIVEQQKLMWRESGQQTDAMDEDKQDKGVGPSPEHQEPIRGTYRHPEKPREDRYEVHEEFLDRFLNVEKNRMPDQSTPTKDLKSQDVTQIQGLEADMQIAAVQTFVKSRWSSAMHQMSSEMDAVTEMDRDIRYRIPYDDERSPRSSRKLSSAGSAETRSKISDRYSSASMHSERSSSHSVARPTIQTYIPPSEMLSGIEKKFSPRAVKKEQPRKAPHSKLDALTKYRRTIDEAFSLAEFGPRRDPSEHSLPSSRQITPASSMHKMDGSLVSSLSWDELEAMVTESLLADAGVEHLHPNEISTVDHRLQDAMQVLNELQEGNVAINKKVMASSKKQPKLPSKRFKERNSDVDARIEDAMSLLNELKADQRSLKKGGNISMVESPHQKSPNKSGGLDNWTLEAMSLLNELKSEYEPESKVPSKENLPPEVFRLKPDSSSMRANIEEAMALLRDDTSASPASLLPSSHVSFQPTSQMPKRYY